jgi:hypothetical protein
VPKLYA